MVQISIQNDRNWKEICSNGVQNRQLSPACHSHACMVFTGQDSLHSLDILVQELN